MKLALREEDGISILDVQGNVDAHNFAVLKAGLSRLLQNGKNRIVLNLEGASDLSVDVLRELAILDVFARELSGKIVLSSSNADLKAKVTSFAKPPVVAILPDAKKAGAYLKDLDALEGDEAGESFDEVSKQLDAKSRQVEALEAQLKLSDPKALQSLRAENAELKNKVVMLEAQVKAYLEARPEPVDAEGFLEKFEVLEETIRRMSNDKAAAAQAKK